MKISIKYTAVFLLLVGLLYYNEVLAACDPGSSPSRADLLVTSPTLSGKFYSSGKVCIVNVSGQTISFDTTNMPNYDRLKEDFYTKSSFPKIEVSSSSLTIQNETIYHSGGDFAVFSVYGYRQGVGVFD